MPFLRVLVVLPPKCLPEGSREAGSPALLGKLQDEKLAQLGWEMGLDLKTGGEWERGHP